MWHRSKTLKKHSVATPTHYAKDTNYHYWFRSLASLKACLFNMPPSPASRLSRVFFQITSKALAVESLMWSLNDLLRGAFAGWFIMQIDHTSRGKWLQLGPRKKGILCPGICLNSSPPGRQVVTSYNLSSAPWSFSLKSQALQFSLRMQESSDCSQPTGKLPKSYIWNSLQMS